MVQSVRANPAPEAATAIQTLHAGSRRSAGEQYRPARPHGGGNGHHRATGGRHGFSAVQAGKVSPSWQRT